MQAADDPAVATLSAGGRTPRDLRPVARVLVPAIIGAAIALTPAPA